MAQTRREVELTLHAIRIPVIGINLDADTSHLVTATLIWPRTGIAQKSVSQTCRLNDGTADLSSLNWGKRILCKENVEGRFALSLTVTEDLDDEEVEKFLRFWAGAFLSVGADLVESSLKPAGKLASAPIDYLAKNVAAYPGPKTLVEGLAELDVSDLAPSGKERLLTVQMLAAHDLFQSPRKTGKAGAIAAASRKKLLLKKGAPNGEVTVLIRSL